MKEVILVALGKALPDLLLKDAQIINVFTAEIETGNVAIYKQWIAGIGDYEEGKEIIDLKGKFLAPGFINGHIHLESTHLHPAQFARVVVPRGTTTVVSDLHEIANVLGLKGIKFFLNWARLLPLDFFFMVPSCVPATPEENTGARIGAPEVGTALKWKGVLGLGEMMNFPGVLAGDEEVMKKITSAKGKIVDGHCPKLKDKELNAYISAGIYSDHETTSFEEGEGKLKRGMYLMIREGSSEKNLEALLPLVNENTYRRCFFVSDDRTPIDLLRDGDMDAIVRKAISLGLPPIRAIQMATINPAEYFGLKGIGAIAPGYFANLIVFSDLFSPQVELVFYKGCLVAKEGRALFPLPQRKERFIPTVKVKPFSLEDLIIPGEKKPFAIIEVIPAQILTRKIVEEVKVVEGKIVPDVERDILKLVVVERHRASGNIGLGLVKGFGLKEGALASSIAHDSHNIIAVGVDDADLFLAIQEVIRLQGGLVIASQGKVLASLPLPIAGLLSPLPVEEVVRMFESLEEIAKRLGCHLPSPFASLSFLALPVIPEIRLTDRGLIEIG